MGPRLGSPRFAVCCGLSCHLLFLQPYVPKDPPVLRVTEGPFFSEVVAYYEHVHQVVRLYNLPGAPPPLLSVCASVRSRLSPETGMLLC